MMFREKVRSMRTKSNIKSELAPILKSEKTLTRFPQRKLEPNPKSELEPRQGNIAGFCQRKLEPNLKSELEPILKSGKKILLGFVNGNLSQFQSDKKHVLPHCYLDIIMILDPIKNESEIMFARLLFWHL